MATIDIDPDLIYLNGVDPDTGRPAQAPISRAQLVEVIRADPGGKEIAELHGDVVRSFDLPGRDMRRVEEVGWGLIVHPDTPSEVLSQLEPLLARRRAQAGTLYKQLDAQAGESVRDWYQRHLVSPGVVDPELVPYYLLIVGPPTLVEFSFQYLLGVDYAVGRIAFDDVADYGRYASSVVEQERDEAYRTLREIDFWAPRYEPATELSATLLVAPLADGLATAPGSLKTPLHKEIRFDKRELRDGAATRDGLVGLLERERAPSLLFTASHGTAPRADDPGFRAKVGGLVAPDPAPPWDAPPGTAPVQFVYGSSVKDNANCRGSMAFFFACYGAGTPVESTYRTSRLVDGLRRRIAPEPCVSALPQRLLAHPRGSALAVIGHVDQAWEFSIRPAGYTGTQVTPFRHTLHHLAVGTPVGRAVSTQLGQRYSSLSTELLQLLDPRAAVVAQPSDDRLIHLWLERNDAQNYIVLGDPAARVRPDPPAM